MRVTRRQLSRIIKETLLQEHAYDDAKHSVADRTRESDAADEVLDDLYSLGDQKLADKVDTMIQMGDDLGSILSVIPGAVKDKLMDPAVRTSSKDDGRGHATRAPSAAAMKEKEEANLVDALVKKDPELQDAILSIGYVYYFIREAGKLSREGQDWHIDNKFANAAWRVSAEIKELMQTINLGPEAWDLFKSGKASSTHMDSSTVLGVYLDSASAGHPAAAGSGDMTLAQALQVISDTFPTKNFLVSKINSEIQAATAAAQKQSSAPVAEGKAVRVTRGQMRRIIREFS